MREAAAIPIIPAPPRRRAADPVAPVTLLDVPKRQPFLAIKYFDDVRH
jgi:hypothetical protein